MEIHILSLEAAVKHRPTVPTYAIRIRSSSIFKYPKIREQYDAIDQTLYLMNKEYTFDDLLPSRSDAWGNPGPQKPHIFTDEHAEAIIRDFQPYRNKVKSLAVNCVWGLNRSPAVAMALNEIYDLGTDPKELRSKFKEYNWHVYDTLIALAKKHPELVR